MDAASRRPAATAFRRRSLWCPGACGCHRDDQDCPTRCPPREVDEPVCPAWMRRTLPKSVGHACAQRPQAHVFDPPTPNKTESLRLYVKRLGVVRQLWWGY